MRQFDWMTWTVEATGFLILCMWIVVPIREFRSIFRRIRQRPRKAANANAQAKGIIQRAVVIERRPNPESVSPDFVPPEFEPVEL
jgi:uncharacterized membrane protein YcjF (UPF0283 family)